MKVSKVFMLGLVSVVASLMLVKVNGEEVPKVEMKNGMLRTVSLDYLIDEEDEEAKSCPRLNRGSTCARPEGSTDPFDCSGCKSGLCQCENASDDSCYCVKTEATM